MRTNIKKLIEHTLDISTFFLSYKSCILYIICACLNNSKINIFHIPIAILLLIISYLDLETKEIPLPYSLLLILFNMMNYHNIYIESNIIILFIILLFCIFGWMGFADLFYLIGISFLIPFQFVFILPIACFFTILFVIIKRNDIDHEIPFLPFLTLSTFVIIALL